MRNLAWLAPLILASVLYGPVAYGGPGDRFVHVELLSDVSGIKPGQSFTLGVSLKIESGWHIYWKNPGDSGLTTTVKLELPAGFSAGPVEYPIPARIVLPGDIVNYAYEDETMLLIPVTAPKDLTEGAPVAISAKVRWLVCREMCMPGSGLAVMNLPVSSEVSPANVELFRKWKANLPAEHDVEHVAHLQTSQDLKQTAGGLTGNAKIVIQWKTTPTAIQWFPLPPQGINISDVKVITEKDATTIAYHLDVPSEAGDLHGIESVLAYTVPDHSRQGLRIPARND